MFFCDVEAPVIESSIGGVWTSVVDDLASHRDGVISFCAIPTRSCSFPGLRGPAPTVAREEGGKPGEQPSWRAGGDLASTPTSCDLSLGDCPPGPACQRLPFQLGLRKCRLSTSSRQLVVCRPASLKRAFRCTTKVYDQIRTADRDVPERGSSSDWK